MNLPGSNSTIFCYALPSNKITFEEGINHPEKDFVRHYIKDRKAKNAPYNWDAYYLQLVKPYETLKKVYSHRGFKFINECSWSDYMQYINALDSGVVILFSHCISNDLPEERIEFSDQMVRSCDIAEQLPVDKICIYDFSVCRSLYLRRLTANNKIKGAVGTSGKFIPLTLWLYIYFETFRIMSQDRLDFVLAMDLVFRNVENKKK